MTKADLIARLEKEGGSRELVELVARAIYEANPRGVWNNRVKPMVFEPYAWGDLDPELERQPYEHMARASIAALLRALEDGK